ncbi:MULTISPECIES: CoA-acylating methylmalonate-semialdehyde dehydrogenase [unclassified Thauera]|jgi:malonate-semialdehyde dehydrogenase (acetylating)/methylmalonate-semialdehyde dehydrogenase|uniref:CoA-acylating methylmalonate-semialdehyde dehydrogenase n=1 Tax=unclassified Thauera TaxID=2609274 RepID=UPI0022DD5FC8|nr:MULTISPECIES: CoA-acylating methylmalonate-semialdehyde dehydrogenase [unclassified Thauera]MBS0477538.1 CoA-acylating methylmalonate-semialdehyde dehydrogenase [Pseudomonadota bacterium]WBL64711.1 CoA-acylating methylmalonate-semialdehyde dehydrogenase [Thauera sp. WB-2]HRP26635.1 CoA-acylating methylmalonate-semialdehyde dehydrogenase [Thauera sp.]HRQ59709.1 CoA-acylating methylmalonate-semialdehyde dehydrogenase [Azoarcus taiwanensis]
MSLTYINAPEHIGHWIDNEPRPAGERSQPVFDPALGRSTRQVGLATEAEVDAAVASAATAQHAWGAMAPQKRARVLFKMKELVERHTDDLARLITREHGKTFPDAKGEVQRGLEIIEFACGIPQLFKGQYSDNVGGGISNWSQRAPLGVTAGITPFNFPFMVPMWMAPVSIACGNSFILKPSERDPSPSLLTAELFREAGLPAGVFNVVQGDKLAVDRLLNHPDVQAVSFVGSTPIAKYIYETSARNGKRSQALGGAKNHMVVMPDADLDQAADALIGAAYGSAGERCMAISVAVAVGHIADELVDKVATRARALRVNDGEAEGADMGPIVTAEAKQRIEGYIASGVEQGATLVMDGRGLVVPGREQGYFLGASLFDNVTPDMKIYREEIFGPVLCVVRVDTFAEAVELVNSHAFGNGVACYTRDGRTAQEFAQKIQIGMVGINVPLPVPMAWHSFGGWKQSLFGDHHSYGEEGVRFYTRYKSVMQRWPDSGSKGPEFVMPVN